MRGFTSWFALFVFLGTALTGPSALATEDPLKFELTRQQQLIGVAQAKIRALEALSKRDIEFNRQWGKYWKDVRDLLAEAFQEYQRELKVRDKKIARIGAMVRELQQPKRPDVYLPRTAWSSAKKNQELAARIAKEVLAWGGLVSSLKADWYMVGIGWITQGACDAKIKALTSDTAAIEAGLKDGSYSRWFSDFGWLKVQSLRSFIEAREKTMRSLKEAAAKGEYRVYVPGLGWETAKGLGQKIAAQEKVIQAIQTLAKAKDMRVVRRGLGGSVTEAQVEKALATYDTADKVFKKAVSDGAYKVWFKSGGTHHTRTSLETRLASLQKEIESIRSRVSKGEYKVTIFGSSLNQKEIESSLKRYEKTMTLPDLKEDVRRNTLLLIQKFQKMLALLPKISNYEIFVLTLEKTVLDARIAFLLKLARPDVENRLLRRTQRESWRDEFKKNLELAVETKKDRLQYLQSVLSTWFSGQGDR